MRRLIFQVCVGPSAHVYDVCIASVARYCARQGYDHHVQTNPILKIVPRASKRSESAMRLGYLPIYEKENAFSALDDEDDQIAIIDADVYVRQSASCIFSEMEEHNVFGAVVERDMPLTPTYQSKVARYSEAQYARLRAEADFRWNAFGAEFLNMGVMVLTKGLLPYLEGQTPEQFIRRPEFERFVNGEGSWRWSTDQTLLNFWVRHSGMPFQRLNWRWNALFKGVRDEVLDQAHFIHFFLSSLLPKRGAEIPDIVKKLDEGSTNFSYLQGRG